MEFATSLASNAEAADAICAILNAINVLFSGFLIQQDNIPDYFLPLHYFSVIHYGFFAIGWNEYDVFLKKRLFFF